MKRKTQTMRYEEIGKRIQKAREEAGISQWELSSRLGVTQAALSNYELGKRRLNLVTLERLAEELARPLGYFLEDSEPETTIDEERLDESISEMIALWGEMPEEKEVPAGLSRWRRNNIAVILSRSDTLTA